ncbi:MAG TPA: GtrA family protein [Sporosarcina sp.]|nr:GtrA family protein [Sporosarcina sp.]
MKWFKGEFLRFVIVGVINTGTYYGLYLLGLYWLEWHYMMAHFFGFICSLIGSFFLNTYFTYKVKPTWKKFFQFPLTQVANTVITTIILFVLVEWFQLSSGLAPIVAMFFTVPITFIMTGKILKTS